MDTPRKKPRLNNMHLKYQRDTEVYEAVMTDLCLMGFIPREACELLTGRAMADNLTLPEGVIVDEAAGGDE